MRTVEYDKHAPEQPGMPDAKADPSSDWFSPTPGCEMKWHTHGSWKQKYRGSEPRWARCATLAQLSG